MNSVLIQNSWVIKKTGEVFFQVSTSNKKIKTKDCKLDGLYPVVDQGKGSIAGYISDSTKVINTDLPLVIFGDHTRAIKWVDYEFVPGADGTKVLGAESYLNSKFFYYQLRSIEIPDKGYARHFKYLKESDFFVPPLAEQKQIADKLDTLLAQVERTKTRLDAIPKILKRFRQSVLAAAVSGKLTEDWRESDVIENNNIQELLDIIDKERLIAWGKDCGRIGRKRRYKEPVKVSVVDFPNIPCEWRWVTVDRISSKVVDGVHKKPNYQAEGIPFVTVKNLTAGDGISFKKLNYISKEDHNFFFKRANPEKGDILISKDGTLGVVRRIETDIEFSIFVSVALVKPVCNEMGEYLSLAFKSPVVQAQMIGVGSGLQHIHLTDLRRDVIPVPPMSEQKEIVRRVEELFGFADRIEARVKKAQGYVNHLTQSILAKAFRGELTADWRKQNPDLISGENSAQSLLDKIKVEREKLKPVKKKRTAKKKKTG